MITLDDDDEPTTIYKRAPAPDVDFDTMVANLVRIVRDHPPRPVVRRIYVHNEDELDTFARVAPPELQPGTQGIPISINPIVEPGSGIVAWSDGSFQLVRLR